MKIWFALPALVLATNAHPAFAQCAAPVPSAVTQPPPMPTQVPDAPIPDAPIPDMTNPVVPTVTPMTADPPMPGTPVNPPIPGNCNPPPPPPPPTVVNGQCGAANGVAVSSPPNVNLCTTGTPTIVSGSGPWNWSCLGSNGGTDAQCGAPLLPPNNVAVMGETAVFPDTDGGHGGLLLVQDATTAQPGIIQSLSFYVVTPMGQLRLGLYDAKGHNGNPRNLVAQTHPFTPAFGWNTKPVTNPVNVPAGKYWLAYNPGSSGLEFPVERDNGTCKWARHSFTRAMPATFPTIIGTDVCHWDLYGTLTLQ